MTKFLSTLVVLLLGISQSIAQFDTIAGPFSSTNGLVAGEDKIYLTAAANNFSTVNVLEVDLADPQFPATSIFTDPFGSPISELFVFGEDLYLTSAGPTTMTGIIYRVNDIGNPSPSSEIYLELPWFATSLTIKDSTMYIARFSFVGGGIYTYDMRDPNAELQEFLSNNTNDIPSLEINGDQLLISDATDSKISKVNLSAAVPIDLTYISNLDFATGMAVDNGLLYVAVGNYNSNTSSRIKVYDVSSGSFPVFLEDLATTTNLAIIEVARVNGQTYILEGSSEPNQPQYLLRIQDLSSSVLTNTLQQIEVFPNPTTDRVIFRNVNPEAVQVIDAAGRNVLSITNPNGEMDLSGLPLGVYNLLIQLEDGDLGTARVVKE